MSDRVLTLPEVIELLEGQPENRTFKPGSPNDCIVAIVVDSQLSRREGVVRSSQSRTVLQDSIGIRHLLCRHDLLVQELILRFDQIRDGKIRKADALELARSVLEEHTLTTIQSRREAVEVL